MKILGYGWIKSGDTLKKAIDEYGVNAFTTKETNPQAKPLVESVTDLKKEIKKSFDEKHVRKSAKPRMFRVVLEEIES